jgi:hypothetical protein
MLIIFRWTVFDYALRTEAGRLILSYRSNQLQRGRRQVDIYQYRQRLTSGE